MNEDKTIARIDRLPSGRVLEFAAFGWPTAALAEPDWPNAPGGLRYGADQRIELLHFAPGRWLAPDPSEEVQSLLAAAAAASAGTALEVSGKWDQMRIAGSGAARLLACGVCAEEVLAERECAALTLFDCPAILARAADGFRLWVQSSYSADFLATAARFQGSLQSS
jgi:heterotetrameric sarcosine oxidase gamma subunit